MASRHNPGECDCIRGERNSEFPFSAWLLMRPEQTEWRSRSCHIARLFSADASQRPTTEWLAVWTAQRLPCREQLRAINAHLGSALTWSLTPSRWQYSLLGSYTVCPRRNGQNFGRVFLMLNYTDITQNTYIQSWTVTEIMAIQKCGLLGCPRTVRRPWCYTYPLCMPGNQTPPANVAMQWPWRDYASAAACVKCLVTLRTTMTWVRVFL